MDIRLRHRWFALIALSFSSVLATYAWADPPTRFSNIGSVANTRHNMTQSTVTGGINVVMDNFRNNYGEVCVYCHTPHGGNTSPQMPLWNRTVKATTYTVYTSSSLTQTVSQPGNNSLTCLSCHDGQTAIDSIINMPGSGNYLASQTTSQNTAFLDAWDGALGPTTHFGLNSSNNTLGDGAGSQGCTICHKTAFSAFFPDFTLFNIGTDLTNDHPVGVTFPTTTGSGTDWNTPGGVKGTSLYFDVNTNTKMDKDEIRTYSGQVECASCHDPHGVPDPANGNIFKPTFLRVANTGSALCLTCHNK